MTPDASHVAVSHTGLKRFQLPNNSASDSIIWKRCYCPIRSEFLCIQRCKDWSRNLRTFCSPLHAWRSRSIYHGLSRASGTNRGIIYSKIVTSQKWVTCITAPMPSIKLSDLVSSLLSKEAGSMLALVEKTNTHTLTLTYIYIHTHMSTQEPGLWKTKSYT